MSYAKCADCSFYQKGLPHKCKRTMRSCLWERASKLSTIKRMNGQGPDRLIAAVHNNCGFAGQFFKAKHRNVA